MGHCPAPVAKKIMDAWYEQKEKSVKKGMTVAASEKIGVKLKGIYAW